MSVRVLPVPSFDWSDGEDLGKVARDPTRTPRPWTDPQTGKVCAVRVEPRYEGYSVGVPGLGAFVVARDAYIECGNRAFSCIRQTASAGYPSVGGHFNDSLCMCDGGDTHDLDYRVSRVGNTWTLTVRRVWT